MRWVKASERMPDPDDRTSVDFEGDVIVKTYNVAVCAYGISTINHSTLDESEEWLEGWNVDVASKP
jgi:hypothetical protein